MFAETFVLLYAAHLAADYPLQTDHQASCKADKTKTGWLANAAHAGTHVAASAVALAAGWRLLDLPLTIVPTLLLLAWIGGTHGFIDRRWPITWWMQHTRQDEFIRHGGAAHVDQTAHVLALVAGALAIAA